MTWWVITALNTYPASTAFTVKAQTNQTDHLFLAWAYHKPARHPVYRTTRGLHILCGYRYVWDTPTIVEQSEPGDTLSHTITVLDLVPLSTIWYYLFAPDGPYGLEIQGPLLHVTLEYLMPKACRIARAAIINVAHNAWTPIPLDLALFDTDNMWDPAPNPDRVTIRTAGLWILTAHATWNTQPTGARLFQIYSNLLATLTFAGATASAQPGYFPSHNVSTIVDLAAGDFLRLFCYQNSGAPLDILLVPGQRPALSAVLIDPH